MVRAILIVILISRSINVYTRETVFIYLIINFYDMSY